MFKAILKSMAAGLGAALAIYFVAAVTTLDPLRVFRKGEWAVLRLAMAMSALLAGGFFWSRAALDTKGDSHE